MEIKKQCESGKAKCVQCDGNGCNDAPKRKMPTLSCIQCDRSAECAFGQKHIEPTPCQSDVLLGVAESCYVHVNSCESIDLSKVLENI